MLKIAFSLCCFILALSLSGQTKCDIKEVYASSQLYELDRDARILANGQLLDDALILVPTTLEQGVYEVEVRREDNNLYQVVGREIYIETRYCYEYASYREDVLINWESNYGYNKGTLVFDYD